MRRRWGQGQGMSEGVEGGVGGCLAASGGGRCRRSGVTLDLPLRGDGPLRGHCLVRSRSAARDGPHRAWRASSRREGRFDR